MKNIYLCWAKNERNEYYNFGDDINPYLINRLTGKNAVYIKFAGSRLTVIKKFLSKVVRIKYVSGDFRHFVRSLFISKYVVAAGSILSWYSSKRALVWGAGIMNKTDKVNDSTFLCVRGELTKNRIIELGYKAPDAIGDPAILLPIVYNPNIKKQHKLGIIPHIIHFSETIECFKNSTINIVNLNNPNTENIINEILSCKMVLSSSLHGLIVAHSYNIPALWFENTNYPLSGDSTKFYDYFSSVEIEHYKPIDFNIIKPMAEEELIGLFKSFPNESKANVNIRELQRKILSVAPFSVKKSLCDIMLLE